MDKDIKVAKIGALAVIAAAVIGGLFAIVPVIMQNNNLKKDYEELQAQNAQLAAQQSILQDSYENSQNKYNTLNKDYIALQNQLEALEKACNNNTPDGESLQNSDSVAENDQIEIDEILETLHYYQNDEATSRNFENLLTDSDELELFYKMYLSIRYYKYSNIIMAFQEYGIDCEQLSVSEAALECWDIENLYIYCQIEENIGNSEEKVYLFNDYKMEPIDTCNYKGYGFAYQNETDEDISKDLNECISKFIKKMKRNSLPIS